MIRKVFLNLLSFTLIISGFNSYGQKKIQWINANVKIAERQTLLMAGSIGDSSTIPATINKEGSRHLVNLYDWRSGFFAGNMWHLYDFSKDPLWERNARRWTAALAPLQYFTEHHDLGFMVYCSYGMGYRLTGDENYLKILIQAARSLSTRFHPATGTIKSWNQFKSWTSGNTFYFPVIIDNMMNLELLFFASEATGDPKFKHIAITHADATLKNHFRKDFSAYHVVFYDSANGQVLGKESAQGYAHESAWARGQAWALYGFTTTYRWTKDKRYLDQAIGIANFLMNHPNLPKDKIPYWDLNAGQAGYTPCSPGAAKYSSGVQPRDASAAAIIASALLELCDYVSTKERKSMIQFATDIIQSLSSSSYLAAEGTNANFLLKHNVGSIPHGGEIDVPLIYADYYFLESLARLKKKK